jgi:hypothetical protein
MINGVGANPTPNFTLMEKTKETKQQVSDFIIQKPIPMTVCETVEVTKWRFFKKRTVQKEIKHEFLCHPATVGKMMVLSKLYLDLDFNEEDLDRTPIKECMRLVRDKTDVITRMMAVATIPDKELLNEALISERAEFFKWVAKPNDFGTVLIAILSTLDLRNFSLSMRLTKMFDINKIISDVEPRTDRIEK